MVYPTKAESFQAAVLNAEIRSWSLSQGGTQPLRNYSFLRLSISPIMSALNFGGVDTKCPRGQSVSYVSKISPKHLQNTSRISPSRSLSPPLQFFPCPQHHSHSVCQTQCLPYKTNLRTFRAGLMA